MADETEGWSRPDMGVDPEDYVENGHSSERDADDDDASQAGDDEPGATGDDRMAPGQSLLDENGDDVEPNEPG